MIKNKKPFKKKQHNMKDNRLTIHVDFNTAGL